MIDYVKIFTILKIKKGPLMDYLLIKAFIFSKIRVNRKHT